MAKKDVFKIDFNKLPSDTLYVIDANAVAGTKFFHLKDCSWKVDGKMIMTGAIFAVMSILRDIPLQYNPRIIFCFDAGKTQRAEENSDYKSGRPGFGDDYLNQLKITQSILKLCGFEVLTQKGYESDDFVVAAVEDLRDFYEHVVVITNDADMCQLVDDKTSIRMVHTKRSDVTKENFESVMGFPYNLTLLEKSIVGCASDSVKGVEGVGPKGFLKLLDKHLSGYAFDTVRKENKERELLELIFRDDADKLSQALDSYSLVVGRRPSDLKFESTAHVTDFVLLANECHKYGMRTVVNHISDCGLIKSII